MHELDVKNHVVIMGGGALKKLQKLVAELRSDRLHVGVDIVVVSDAYEENPIPSEIRFIKGNLGSDDVLRRACVHRAQFILVYGYNDNDSIMTTMAVDEVNRHGNLSVYLRDRENIKHIERINHIRRQINEAGGDFHSPEITVITRIADLMLAREASNPDLSSVIVELVTENKGSTFYSFPAWPDMDVCLAVSRVRDLLQEHVGNPLLIGFKRYADGEMVINPTCETFICPNDHLFVIATERPKINWKRILKD